MAVSPKELQFQAQNIVQQVQQTAPKGAEDVGVVVLFFNRSGDQAVGFATNDATNDQRVQTVKVLREFIPHLNPSRIVLLS